MPENKNNSGVMNEISGENTQPGAPVTAQEAREERFDDEKKRRILGRDSKHEGSPAEEWSPGSDQMKS